MLNASLALANVMNFRIASGCSRPREFPYGMGSSKKQTILRQAGLSWTCQATRVPLESHL